MLFNFLKIISETLLPYNMSVFSDLYLYGSYSNWIAVKAYTSDVSGTSNINSLGVQGECDVWV